MNQNRKEQIIKTAARLYRDKGYNAVSMRDLAENLGIKASSIYNHIPSKEEILAEVIMDLVREFTSHITMVINLNCSILEKIKMIIEMHVHMTVEKGDSLACMNKEWRNLGVEKQEIYVRLRGQYEDRFLELIKQGINKGEIENRNPEVIVFSILSTLRTLYHWYSSRKHLSEEELVTTLQANLLIGILPKTKSRSVESVR